GSSQASNGAAQGEEGEPSPPEHVKAKPLRGLSKKKLEAYNAKLAKRGVVYLSRVPPHMKPAKLRHLLEHHGQIERIYLAEDERAARKNKKSSGKGKLWAEGWVEFADKRIAKAVAESLNNTPIGGSKRDYYREDIWNLKYLKHFKWEHLTEKVAYERRVREQKLRMETMQAKRETEAYQDMVNKGKTFAKIEERKRKKAKAEGR
ncbi:unnamed protein product, partial [Chrysoparadoxa australica]